MFGDEIYRVTGRKDKYGELGEFICNECRFDRKLTTEWVTEGPREIDRSSVIAQNHYGKIVKQSIILPLEEKTKQQE